MLGFMQG